MRIRREQRFTGSTPLTATPSFHEKLDHRMATANTLLCVGLDPNLAMLPAGVSSSAADITAFCKSIVTATHRYAAAFKPNLAFFTQLGPPGLQVLANVCTSIPRDIPVILDCKVGDVGETARAYARSWFDVFDVDAITVNPYLGEDALAPFLEYPGRGVIVICKTSNPGSGDLQDRTLQSGESLFIEVASRCATWEANYPASVGLVVGATYPSQLEQVRRVVGNQIILLPGVGAQGGDLQGTLSVGLDANGRGLLCSASRSIIHAGSATDFAEKATEAAAELHATINSFRESLSGSAVNA
jgi:orotidine-5'-phosphate decarboxylase